MQTKTYLGDAVYAELDRGMIKLTVENGLETTDTIYLEPEVLSALVSWVKRGFPGWNNAEQGLPDENHL